MISLGKKPKLSFKVDALVDGKVQNLPFSDLIDGPTIVSVYMRNNTSACDKQAAELGKSEKVLGKQGFKIVALSRDTCASHLKYAAKHGFKFALVSDPDDLFAQAVDRSSRNRCTGRSTSGRPGRLTSSAPTGN